MKAIFKENNKLVLNSADRNEQLVLGDFIQKATNGEYSINYTKTLDINGDISGMVIELSSTEPSTPTEAVED